MFRLPMSGQLIELLSMIAALVIFVLVVRLLAGMLRGTRPRWSLRAAPSRGWDAAAEPPGVWSQAPGGDSRSAQDRAVVEELWVKLNQMESRLMNLETILMQSRRPQPPEF